MSSRYDDPTRYDDPESFNFSEYVRSIPIELLTTSAGRRALTRMDPLAFALVYMDHMLRDESTGEQITMSPFHIDLVKQAIGWIRPLVRRKAYRDAYVAPRQAGKSSWLFLMLPMWIAAHEHQDYILALSDTAKQAENHLMNFRTQLETNPLLKEDYPDLCTPLKGSIRSAAVANSRGQIRQANGFTFQADGISGGLAGLQVDGSRPKIIILDDIEGGEGSYSLNQAEKRLAEILTVVLPLNTWAHTVFVGTVTLPGSIIHQIVKQVTRPEDCPAWVAEQNITAHYYPAIVTNPDGTERSFWPEKFPLEQMLRERHTRDFRLGMMNDPMAADGEYWTDDVFQYGDCVTATRTLLSIDPAVTSKDKSDFTGMAVVSYSPVEKKCVVRHAAQLRLSPEGIRREALKLLDQFAETAPIGLVYIEVNQGADLWDTTFRNFPVKVRKPTSSLPKKVRAAMALKYYQRGKVLHEKRLSALEEQCVAFPKGAHDDLVDSVGQGVLRFMEPPKKEVASVRNESYV